MPDLEISEGLWKWATTIGQAEGRSFPPTFVLIQALEANRRAVFTACPGAASTLDQVRHAFRRNPLAIMKLEDLADECNFNVAYLPEKLKPLIDFGYVEAVASDSFRLFL